MVVEKRGEHQVIARRDVELLDTSGTASFVRGTMLPGDQIVSSGTHRVVVGQYVSTINGKLAQVESESLQAFE